MVNIYLELIIVSFINTYFMQCKRFPNSSVALCLSQGSPSTSVDELPSILLGLPFGSVSHPDDMSNAGLMHHPSNPRVGRGLHNL